MHIVVILDITPMDGEPRRESEQVIADLEDQLDGFGGLDVANASGSYSTHEIKVAGIGKDIAAAQQSLADRKQYARQD